MELNMRFRVFLASADRTEESPLKYTVPPVALMTVVVGATAAPTTIEKVFRSVGTNGLALGVAAVIVYVRNRRPRPLPMRKASSTSSREAPHDEPLEASADLADEAKFQKSLAFRKLYDITIEAHEGFDGVVLGEHEIQEGKLNIARLSSGSLDVAYDPDDLTVLGS